MKKILKPKVLMFLTVIFSALLAATLVSCAPQKSSKAPESQQTAVPVGDQTQASNPAVANTANTAPVIDNETEDTVVINISNIGRSNPFRPFQEKSIMIGSSIMGDIPSINIPQPPAYNPNSSISALLKIKVNGILYDPVKSSAIINVDGSDYMVHKGDYLFDFYVTNITQDKVTIKTGNNAYSAGIGEIIEGNLNEDPVQRKVSSFGGSSNTPYIKLMNPSNLPSIN